jgi:hypothetical protein
MRSSIHWKAIEAGPFASQALPMIIMRRFLDNWPKIAFIYLPLLIVVSAATVRVCEQHQPDTNKAIRLVRESNSRKENFTVQQYLYSTVFYRQRQGEPVQIDGWRANISPDPAGAIIVQFSYSDSSGPHVATWEASVKAGQATPLNDAARDLSWH